MAVCYRIVESVEESDNQINVRQCLIFQFHSEDYPVHVYADCMVNRIAPSTCISIGHDCGIPSLSEFTTTRSIVSSLVIVTLKTSYDSSKINSAR